MSPWTRQEIRSDADPENPRPWYVLALDEVNRTVRVTGDSDGGSGVDMAGEDLDLSGVPDGTAVRVAVTEAGDLVRYEPGDDVPPLRAHLSDLAPVEDLTWLEFVEPDG